MNLITKFALSSIALITTSTATTIVTTDVISWDLSTGTATVDPNATTISGGSATAGPGLSSVNFTANGFGGTENSGLLDSSPNLATVIADGQYLSFSVTPGNQDFTNLTFDYYINTVDRSSNTVVLMSSVDGFTDGSEIASYTNSTAGSTAAVSFDVSSYTSETSAVEFRLYLYGKGSSPNSGSETYISNLALEGPVTVPEPSSFALLGLGALAILARRKRA